MKIELAGVSKKYGSLRALDRVRLEIQPGEIISLLGENGAGKTTLFRCLTGIAALSEGKIFFDGEEFGRGKLKLRQRIFFLPDFPILFGAMTVIRHIGMVLKLYGVLKPESESRVLGLLRDFDLLPLATTPLGFLSRGQLYKAALTALIAVDPDIWLLDEPFASGMDPHGISILKRELRAAADRGRTVLYSTQILDLAERFSDRVCVLHRGEIRAYDTLPALRSRATVDGAVLEEIFQKLREEKTP